MNIQVDGQPLTEYPLSRLKSRSQHRLSVVHKSSIVYSGRLSARSRRVDLYRERAVVDSIAVDCERWREFRGCLEGRTLICVLAVQGRGRAQARGSGGDEI